MKLLMLCALTSLLTVVFSVHAVRLSEPVQADELSETFGARIQTMPEQVKLNELLRSPDKYANRVVSLSAEVSQVCQKKGCFFIAQQDDKIIRVAFKDYGFFVPTDIGGRTVTIVGELVVRQLSTKQAEHYNKDLGKSAAVNSGSAYEIVATSVRVPRL